MSCCCGSQASELGGLLKNLAFNLDKLILKITTTTMRTVKKNYNYKSDM